MARSSAVVWGTGMPYWGPMFTDAQIWALVDFLWTFQFNSGLEGADGVADRENAVNSIPPEPAPR